MGDNTMIALVVGTLLLVKSALLMWFVWRVK